MSRPPFDSLFQREAALARRRSATVRTPIDAAGPSRRQFLQGGLAAGLAAGLPPLLAGCGGDDDDGPPRGKVEQTLFFNLSHLAHAGKTYYLEAGNQTHRLVPTAEKPRVLSSVRQRNEFLASVDDANITHHVEGVLLPATTMQLNYVWTWTNQTSGEWQMAGVYAATPSTTSVAAYAHLRAKSSTATLRRSHKRKRYGVRPAASAQDLADESVLLDTSTHAATLIGLNPNFLAYDGDTHAIVQNSYIDGSAAHDDLSDALTTLGGATLETSPGTIDPGNWATLRPALNPDGTPHRVLKDANSLGRIQATPIFHPTVAASIGAGHVQITPPVFQDETLGLDTTASPTASAGQGKLWTRRDGRPTVVNAGGLNTATQAVSSNLTLTPKQSNPDRGLDCQMTFTDQGDTILLVANFTNTYLRYLSLWIAFFDEAGNQLQLGQVDGFTDGTLFKGDVNVAVDKSTWQTRNQVLVGVIPPPATIFGVPVNAGPFEGTMSVSINVPKAVHKVSFRSGGLGTGQNDDTEAIAGGAAMTIINNYMVTTLFAGLGAIPELDTWSSILQTISYDFVEAVFAEGLDVTNGEAFLTAQTMIDQGMNLLTNFLNYLAGQIVEKALSVLFKQLGIETIKIAAEDGVERAVPLAGLVMNVISAIIGAADVVLTTVDICLSPWVYYNEAVFAYDLGVTLVPDNSSTFPSVPSLLTLTALFDDGTPQTLTQAWGGTGESSLTFTFKQVPSGGSVTVTAAFEQQPTVAGAGSILLGKGSTGTVPNTGGPVTIPIDVLPFPIDNRTIYQHQKRTMLDDNGNHIWVTGPKPTINLGNLSSGNPGQLNALRGITLRQGTATKNGVPGVPLRIGYAWSSQNLGPGAPVACQGGTVGELEQVATLNGDTPTSNFAVTACGSNRTQERIAFQLVGGAQQNFYLDTSTATDQLGGFIRQVTLDPVPQIDGNASNRAFCTLTLPCDSLLLHPAGYFVSVSNQYDVFEILKVPDTPLDDATAQSKLRAFVRSGSGARPGLVTGPVCAAVTSKGVLLILEQDNNRIQAFDVGSNPVQFFQNAPNSSYWLTLPDTDPASNWIHLDMKVDFSDMIYVLSYNPLSANGGYEYRLNVYSATQSDLKPISTTKNLFADKIAVDLWRNIYSLNYEVLKIQSSGQLPPLTEPTVSLWTPCNVGQTCPV